MAASNQGDQRLVGARLSALIGAHFLGSAEVGPLPYLGKMSDSFAAESVPSAEPEQHAPEIEDGTPLTPDEAMYARLTISFRRLAARQNEIMRLARYVKERAEEIDDAKLRAKQLIEQRLTEIDEHAIEELMDSFLPFVRDSIDDENLSEEERDEAVSKALTEIVGSLPDGAISSYLESVIRVAGSPPAVPMLYSSLVVSLVGELETLVGEITRALYEHDPIKLEDSERQFKWSEIAAFGTLDEFRAHAIERAVEAMLHGSFSDWLGFLQTKFDVKAPRLAAEFEAIEIVQRRHAIVHAGGLASRQYLDKLSKFKELDVALEDELEVTFEYLARAADVLLVVALGLVSSAGFKVCKQDEIVEAFEDAIANRCFFLLQERRFGAVKMIVEQVPRDRMKSESSRLIIQVNGWIAMKALGEFEKCIKEVKAFDVSARSNDMVLAKLTLLGEIKPAYALARKMVDSGDLKQEHWLTWPLLEDLREHHRKLTA